jgi:prepilin-type N-terminal cleavage/methylation domain-containing protein
MIRCQKTRPPRSVPLVLSRGFTLIELSIVVVIISMLLSLGLGVLNAQLVSAAHSETKKRQAIIKDALTAYLGAHKRLPCPDVPNNTHGATDTSQVTGAEDRTGGLATGDCSGNIGVVPYATLGLGRDVALDGWGNFMSYSIPAGSGTCPGTGINWSLTDCFGAAKASPYSLFEGTVAAQTLAASNVLAIVISHGPNGFAAWGRQGSRNVLPSRCEEAHNAIATVPGVPSTANAFLQGRSYRYRRRGHRPDARRSDQHAGEARHPQIGRGAGDGRLGETAE